MKNKIFMILMCAALVLTTACSNNGDPSGGSSVSSDESETGSFAHGEQDGNTYTSEFFGIKAELPEGWTLQSEEELAQTNGISDMSDENADKALNKSGVLYEMFALTETSANVNIAVENLNITNGGKTLSAEEYIDLSIGNLEKQYKAAGIAEVTVEKSTVDFLGSEKPCISVKLENEGQELFQKMVPLTNGIYIGAVTFTGPSEEEISTETEMFSSL